PGTHIAEASAWLSVVSILSTLDVTKGADAHGSVLEHKIKYDNMTFRSIPSDCVCLGRCSLICRVPSKLECRIRPQSNRYFLLASDGAV
ncbi:hypothetical protein OBBRIDRAFT_735006, partial [Obba rivulosa]